MTPRTWEVWRKQEKNKCVKKLGQTHYNTVKADPSQRMSMGMGTEDSGSRHELGNYSKRRKLWNTGTAVQTTCHKIWI